MILLDNMKPTEEPSEHDMMTYIPAVIRHDPSGFQFQTEVDDFEISMETFQKYDKDGLDVSFTYYDKNCPGLFLTLYVYPTLSHLADAMSRAGQTEVIEPGRAIELADAKTLQELADAEFAQAVDEVLNNRKDAEIIASAKDEAPAPCTKFLGFCAGFTFRTENDEPKESELLIIPCCKGKWSLKIRVTWPAGELEKNEAINRFLGDFSMNFSE